MIKQVKLLTDDRGRVRIEYRTDESGPCVYNFSGNDYDCRCYIDVEGDLKKIIEDENKYDAAAVLARETEAMRSLPVLELAVYKSIRKGRAGGKTIEQIMRAINERSQWPTPTIFGAAIAELLKKGMIRRQAGACGRKERFISMYTKRRSR